MEKLSENEFYRKKLRLAVKARDTDKDGKITLKDFQLIVQRHKEQGVPEKHLKALRNACNKFCNTVGLTDDSISLTYEDFKEIYIQKIAEVKDKGGAIFRESFNIVDKNENGEISFEEWVIHNKALNINEVFARAPFEAMDTNSDGKVSMEEFVAYHTEYFHTAEDKLNSSILHGPLD